MNKESNTRKGTRARTRRARKAKQQQPQPPPDLLYSSNQGRDGDNYPSMAMMKEKQRETIDKKMRGNYDNLGGLTNEGAPHCFYDGTMRGGMLDCDERKDDPLGLSDELMNKSCVSSSNMSCSLGDHKSYLTSDMCSLDNKLDDSFLEGGLPSSCKSNKGDLLDDSDFPHDLMLDTSMSTCKPHKTEDIIAADPEFPPDTCDSMLPAIGMPMGLTSSESMIDNIQPLPSNIINKQPTTMEGQYMQSQSQVFVFSTALANKSAESVMQGHYPSIIAYHCAQPKTKQYLEKHPLKSSQFDRQNSNPWLNSFVHAKQKGVPGSRRGGGRGAYRNNVPPYMMPDMMNPMQDQTMAMNSRFPMWNQPNMNPMNGGGSHGHMMSPLYHGNMSSPVMGHMSTRAPPPPPPTPHLGGNQSGIHPMKSSQMDMMCENSNSNPMMSNNMMSSLPDFPDDNMHMSPHNPLQGVQIPDENLTPQQRQHREVKLATLQQIGQMLLPENNQLQSDQVPEMQQTSTGVEDLVSSLTRDSGDIGNLQRPMSTSGTNAEWQKIQYELFDDRKKKSEIQTGIRGNSRSQGPPPPYHQTTRSASVPIAISSPNPTSPGNNTSNLSLPSPRTCSSLNSPASRQRPVPSPTTQISSSVESPGQAHGRSMNLSNPSTPLSSSTHLSPNSKQKDSKLVNNEFSPATSGQHSPDGIFGRSLQTLAQQQQQKQQHPGMPSVQAVQHLQQQQSPHLLQSSVNCREPNLMPVPSPQHIQYLNAFEGQELTIQKQPNTSLKDTSGIMSPSLPNAGLDSMLPSVSAADMSCSKVSVSGPSTPSSVDLGNTSRYPPMEFAVPSPSADGRSMSQMRGNGSMKPDVGFNCSSPQISDQQRYHSMPSGFMGQPGKPGMNFMDIASPDKIACNMTPGDHKDISCNNYGRMGVDNVPLNPSMNPANKHSFDPLSSLTQMSQQLTSSIPGSPVNQPPGMMHSGMVPFNNMHMLQMNDMSNMCPNDGQMPYPPAMNMQMANDMSNRMIPCSNSNSLSPKPSMMQSPYPMQRIMSRTPGPMSNSYNGPNIQVKPSAPNTIQYLPSRPQTATSGPRAPPSLDFLQRYSSPMGSMDNKMPPSHPHSMNYYPGNYPGPSGVMNDMMGQMNCSMPPGNQMMRGPMRQPNNGNMIRMSGGVVGMGYNPEQMYGAGPNPNCPMYVPGGGPKVQSMGVAPDATQPLPPSIGQSNNFKNSPFIGPTTADPNYAQQFHNFQQQLYATNTRTQMGNQSMSAPNQYFVPK